MKPLAAVQQSGFLTTAAPLPSHGAAVQQLVPPLKGGRYYYCNNCNCPWRCPFWNWKNNNGTAAAARPQRFPMWRPGNSAYSVEHCGARTKCRKAHKVAVGGAVRRLPVEHHCAKGRRNQTPKIFDENSIFMYAPNAILYCNFGVTDFVSASPELSYSNTSVKTFMLHACCVQS